MAASRRAGLAVGFGQVIGLTSLSRREERIDVETGKPFYVDHNTQTTSWVDPRDVFIKVWIFIF